MQATLAVEPDQQLAEDLDGDVGEDPGEGFERRVQFFPLAGLVLEGGGVGGVGARARDAEGVAAEGFAEGCGVGAGFPGVFSGICAVRVVGGGRAEGGGVGVGAGEVGEG